MSLLLPFISFIRLAPLFDPLLEQTADVLAYASGCQRDQFDRPISGFLNICPGALQGAPAAAAAAWGAWQAAYNQTQARERSLIPLSASDHESARVPTRVTARRASGPPYDNP